jgi:curli biogenesis system outer membrane secretion channel CsgG
MCDSTVHTIQIRGLMKMKKVALLVSGLFLASGCATMSETVAPVEAPVPKSEQIQAQKSSGAIPTSKRYKSKVAIARFTNETNYGRALMTDNDFDRLGKQASDMLSTRLVKSGKFIVFERTDLNKVLQEQKITGVSNIVGSDTLIIGSVTEFGRSISGKSGFLSSTKVQLAHAKVDIRLVDTKTGQAFFSATGAGEASTESGEIAGYGSHSEYDSTLNDSAIAAAITDVIDKLVSTLDERAWRTDILDISGQQIFISGGQRQGIMLGDILQVMAPGLKVKSQQTGFEIYLPAKRLATIRVTSFFGDNENNEGSACELVSGTVDKGSTLYVEEAKK